MFGTEQKLLLLKCAFCGLYNTYVQVFVLFALNSNLNLIQIFYWGSQLSITLKFQNICTYSCKIPVWKTVHQPVMYIHNESKCYKIVNDDFITEGRGYTSLIRINQSKPSKNQLT